MNGFYRSKVMLVLFIGMPLVALLLYFLNPDLEGMPLGAFTAVMISSMAGLLASTTLSVNIINERSTGVYDLFLVRPVKRSHLLVSKFVAVISCVTIAAALALLLANGYDWLVRGVVEMSSLGEPMMVTITMACVSCAVAVLVGILVNSVLVGVILTIYGGNQVSAVIALMSLQDIISIEAATTIGLITAGAVLCLAVVVYRRKLDS